MHNEVRQKNVLIQYLRALSVMAVLLYHFGFPLPNGFLGVDVFFVISGFVITQSLQRIRHERVMFSILFFFKKRIMRLFPAFLLFFLITMGMVLAFYSPNMGIQQEAIRTGIGSLFAVSNIVLMQKSSDYFGISDQSNPFLHTWSLAVEEQFYIIYPFVFFLIFYKLINRKLVFQILIFVTLASFALNFLPENSSLNYLTGYFSPIVRIWEFTLGILAAYLKEAFSQFVRGGKKKLSYFLLALIGFLLVQPNKVESAMSLYTLFLLLVVSLFLFICHEKKLNLNENKTILSYFSRTISHLGDISYPLYLFHWPLKVTINLFVETSPLTAKSLLISISVLISSLVYKFIEIPQMKRSSFSDWYWFKLLISGMVLGFALSLLMFWGVTKGWGTSWALGSHKVVSRGCDSGTLDFEKCSWPKADSQGSIVLLGDSMAWSIGDAIIETAHRKDLNAFALVKNGCSATSSPSEADVNCTAWRLKTFKFIKKTMPRVVVIANTKGNTVADLRGMGKLVDDLTTMKIPVVMILSLYGGDEFSSRRSLLYRPGPKFRYFKEVIESVEPYNLSKVIKKKNFLLVRLGDFLCSDGVCPNAINGNDFFNYGGHLSNYGNKAVLEPLYTQINDFLSNQISSNTKSTSR